MARWYGVIVLTFMMLFSVVALVATAVGRLVEHDELVMGHCYDEMRAHCTLSFLDINKDIMLNSALEGLPVELNWSPDNTRLAISQLTPDGVRHAVLHADGSLTHFQQSGFFSAWLSEDRLLLQGEIGDFQVYDFTRETFEYYTLAVFEDNGSFYMVQLSPDGHYIAASPMDGEEVGLFVEPIDVEGTRVLIGGNILDENFDWSPDSRSVAYTLLNPNLIAIDIYVTTVSNGETQQISSSNGDNMFPRWSNRNGRLAYLTRSNFFYYQLNIRENDGTLQQIDLNALLNEQIGNVFAMVWSPDDHYILLDIGLMNNRSGGFFLITIDEPTAIRRLTYGGNNFLPVWRP